MTKNNRALELLRRHVDEKGPGRVASEVGISKATVSLLLAGKYGASTSKMEARILAMYGGGGLVNCPLLGGITPELCAGKHAKAKAIGMKAGNPDTVRLYKTCLNCPIRNPKEAA
jgi:hypothetical protein